jgi:23S rRNA (cytidine1920-2'-O)/16S rRNA (cytidine1409-2'-O)-methyltransferase
MNNKPGKKRLDVRCVELGLVESRQRAQALILAKKVLVDGEVCSKAGTPVATDAKIALKEAAMPYVSRGGLKLQAALDHFQIDVAVPLALDVGASTGGFTDCLLQRGAEHVLAVDVGYGQLAWTLRQDERVTCIERFNARHMTKEPLLEALESSSLGSGSWPPRLCTIDVSFISLTLVLPAVMQVLAAESPIVALVKPQFEARREDLGKGGVVRDPALREAAIERVLSWAKNAGLRCLGGIDSPVAGPKGNVEHLALLMT